MTSHLLVNVVLSGMFWLEESVRLLGSFVKVVVVSREMRIILVQLLKVKLGTCTLLLTTEDYNQIDFVFYRETLRNYITETTLILSLIC